MLSPKKTSIQQRYVKTIVMLVLAFFILLATGTAILEIFRLNTHVRQELTQQATNNIEKVELRLSYLIQNLQAFAASSLAINSLIDTAGRTSYLPNAIEDLARMKELHTIIMFDFSGKPIHSNTKTLPEWFTLQSVQPAISVAKMNILFNSQRGTFLVIVPISYYATPQGGIAAEISLTTILSENIGNKDYYYQFFVGRDWQFANRLIDGKVIGVTAMPPAQSILNPFQFSLRISQLKTTAMRPIISTLYEMLYLGLAGIIASVFIAWRVGKKLAQPIVTLTDRVRQDIHPCGPIGTHDELEILAKTFDENTRNLLDAKNQLELHVHERTAQLEDKTRQLQEQHQELEKVNQSLTQANTELKYIDKLKDEFISTVSHELRTPLTSIRGTLGLIAGGVVSNDHERHNELINIALANSERLTALISDLLDMQKFSAGMVELQRATISVDDLLRHAISGSLGYADQFKVHLVYQQATARDLWVHADAHRIRQVLDNLISNAIKYSPAGSSVEVFAEPKNNMIRISVRDHGPGIPDKFKSVIFEKFTQVDSTDQRARSGTGLGLSICKDIITAHQGEINFENMPDNGTLFWFELKADIAAEAV